jgi:hypothetical protein
MTETPLSGTTEDAGGGPKSTPGPWERARADYLAWLAGGANGRLHLTEDGGVDVCSVVTGRGLDRLKSYWRRLCLALCINLGLGESWKVFWGRRAGMTIGKNVRVSHGARFDWLAPWLVTLEDGCAVGYEAVVCAHLYYQGKLVARKIVVGRDAVVGVRAIVAASLGPGSVLYPGSVLLSDAPASRSLAGVPASVVD